MATPALSNRGMTWLAGVIRKSSRRVRSAAHVDFDGSNGWYEDAKGIVLPRSAPFALAAICNYRFQLTGQLYRPDYGGAEVSYLGRRKEGGRSYEAIAVKPKGGHLMEWWFDEATALPAREITRSTARTTITSYSDYHDVGGAMIPARETFADDGHIFEIFTSSAFNADPPDIARHLRMPSSESSDYSLNCGETRVPFQFIESPIVDVLINGKGPFHFIFDTGADNVISPELAAEIKARPLMPAVSPEVKDTALKTRYAEIDTIKLGGATLSTQYFKIIQPNEYDQKRKIQGLIGYEFLARFEVAIDYVHSQLILRSPRE